MKLSRRGFLKSLMALPLVGVNLPEVKETPKKPEPLRADLKISQELVDDSILGTACSGWFGGGMYAIWDDEKMHYSEIK